MLLEVHESLLIADIALDDRNEPAMRDALQEEIFQDVMVPNEIRLFHQISRVWLIRLLASVEFLLAYTEVCMIRKVEPGALAILSGIEKFFEVFLCSGQLLIRFHVHVRRRIAEGVHIDTLDLVDVDTGVEFSHESTRTDRNQEVLPVNIHDTQDAIAFK